VNSGYQSKLKSVRRETAAIFICLIVPTGFSANVTNAWARAARSPWRIAARVTGKPVIQPSGHAITKASGHEKWGEMKIATENCEAGIVRKRVSHDRRKLLSDARAVPPCYEAR